MGFVNDFATDDEVESLQLKKYWDKYKPRFKGNYWLGRSPDLTIDRQRKAFAFLVGGGGEYTPGWHIFFLKLGDLEAKVTVDVVEGSSKRFDENPFRIVWNLIRLDIEEGDESHREEVVTALKDMLTTYGYRGIYRQIPNTQVVFQF
ncbi:MAG: hypothetical protein KDJ24_04175 [Gammaproteobacteria bacterium]|nr:hypothetical protein [Gammaproteobacteria bacterium]